MHNSRDTFTKVSLTTPKKNNNNKNTRKKYNTNTTKAFINSAPYYISLWYPLLVSK